MPNAPTWNRPDPLQHVLDRAAVADYIGPYLSQVSLQCKALPLSTKAFFSCTKKGYFIELMGTLAELTCQEDS